MNMFQLFLFSICCIGDLFLDRCKVTGEVGSEEFILILVLSGKKRYYATSIILHL